MSGVLLYKLAVPSIEGQVERARPLQGLEAQLRRSPLVWLMGLPGSGKTSLAAQWVHRAQAAGRRCVWYRLDEDDADIAGLLDALRRIEPDLGLPAWSPDNQVELRGFARRFFGQWLAAQPLTLVFDDCHRLPEGSPVFELLDAARELAGDRLSFLLISRSPPPLPLARGIVPGWLGVYEDLALSLDEAAAVAQAVSGRPMGAVELEQLRAADGWMAHVLALARGGSSHAPGGALEAVGEFLCEELLAMLPPGERRGLRLAAELPELPRAEVPLTPSQARLLDQLAARRWFVDRTEGDAWRLHDLLRDGLRRRNAALETPAALAEARREAAGWVRQHSPEIAMNLLVAAGDEPAALALLAVQGRNWLAQGRHRQLLNWLDALPGEPGPQRLLWRAEALLPLAPEEAREPFARSRAAFVAAGEADAAYRAWSGEVGSYVVQWGAVQGLAELVDELELIEARLGPPSGEWRFRCAADALTALMYGRAEDPRIARYAQATALTVEQAPDVASRIGAAAQLLIYRLWWAGDFPGGRALYQAFDAEVERGDRDGSVPPLARLIWWSNAAIVDWQCGSPQRCYDKVDRGLALAEETAIHVRDFFLLTQGIFCALAQEDWQRAEAYLARLALTERGHRRLDSMVHHFFRSWYCLSRGDAATALAHVQTAEPMAQALGSLFHRVIVLSALAPARLHNGDTAGAVEAYRAQLALAKGSQNPTFAYIAFCAGAEIALATGDEAALAKQVERMLMVKQLGGFHSDCGWRSPVRARLLAFALERGILPETARLWIRQKQLPPPPGYRGAEWPMPVRIRALGGLDVELDRPGENTPAGAKPPTRLRELLAVLVVRRRQGATQDELCDWLWPEAEGDKAAASLKVALHRLRGWLGADAVLLRNGVMALNELCVGCDLWLRMDEGNPLQLATLAGSLLTGCQAPPVRALRERLAALVMR
ncbi:hypothetical protein SNE35_15400 [Paucibacter sp. R3-3]|uniref:Nephrocystin 3-like N-terminal domain-containing protein n=1 Tax=Roseateles agri TaxID=3098619 RepID=A0ABU5DJD9_9BURK|nr:hypothetical protein [Paucibacter sp. R3-3]MDY0745906.1 hypothetical protein [Paucibacter sp. R3-3]